MYIWHLCDEKLDKLPEIQYGGNTARTIIASVPADELDMPASIADYFERQQDYTAEHSGFPLPKLNGESIVNLLSYNDKRVRESANFDCGISMPLSQSFRTAYSSFEVIPDKTHSVIVPFGKGAELIARLSGNISLKEGKNVVRLTVNNSQTPAGDAGTFMAIPIKSCAAMMPYIP